MGVCGEMFGWVKWRSVQTVGMWQRRQSSGPTCGGVWQSEHGLVAALKTSVGWHSWHGRELCCAPSLIGAGCVIALIGEKAVVVWQLSQAVWFPCFTPWQSTQRLPGAGRNGAP